MVIKVEDPSTDETIPRGKQFWIEQYEGIWYTRTTGIWQTVWLEAIHSTYLSKLKFTPDVDQGEIAVEFEVSGNLTNKVVQFEIQFKGEIVVSDTISITEKYMKRSFNLYQRTPENPNLFDVTLKLKEVGRLLDEISTYFGMRKIHTEKGMVYLNNRPYYQKLVLD